MHYVKWRYVNLELREKLWWWILPVITARTGGTYKKGKEVRRRNSVRSLGNASNSLDVSLGNDCGRVGRCIASPAGTSPGPTCQGLALRAVESTTAARSERVSQPLRFRRPS